MTTVTVTSSPVGSQPADVLVVGVIAGIDGPITALGAGPVAAHLAEILTTFGVTGAQGEAIRLPAPPESSAGVILAIGLGAEPAAADPETLSRAAGVAARTLAGTSTAVLALPAAASITTPDPIEAMALGALLGAYEFTAYRTHAHSCAQRKPPPLITLIIHSPHPDALASARRATILAEELNRARDLINTPANDLTPERFAATASAVGSGHGLAVEILTRESLAEAGFGGILGVGQGSANPPSLVRIAYRHPEARSDLALVGKGITYDSGGISLKPVGFNETMKRDMAGAAAVLAAVVAVARLGLAVNVTGWLALAENMPSGSALRPGDILRMYGGRTVEVRNTDAEGRLVLADALVRAAEEAPDAIVDVATLTAGMVIGLGRRTFAVMANDDAFRDRLVGAAGRSGEQAWPMPLPADLRPGLDSSVADLGNTGERMGNGLVAGLFLREFVPASTPWAHLDIAGPAFHEGEPFGYTPTGATGTAVRTLVRLARDVEADPRVLGK